VSDKTKFCRFWQRDKCRNGDDCPYKHLVDPKGPKGTKAHAKAFEEETFPPAESVKGPKGTKVRAKAFEDETFPPAESVEPIAYSAEAAVEGERALKKHLKAKSRQSAEQVEQMETVEENNTEEEGFDGGGSDPVVGDASPVVTSLFRRLDTLHQDHARTLSAEAVAPHPSSSVCVDVVNKKLLPAAAHIERGGSLENLRGPKVRPH
jgi:hypothetical protein